MAIFKCANGITYGVPDKSCPVCKHCTDILYDWEGPYKFFCDIDGNPADSFKNKCPGFESDGSEE